MDREARGWGHFEELLGSTAPCGRLISARWAEMRRLLQRLRVAQRGAPC